MQESHGKKWRQGFQAGYLQAQEEGIKLFAAIWEKEAEARAAEALQKATSAPSSVPTSETPAERRLPLLSVNQDYDLQHILEGISDYFRSAPYIGPVLAATPLDSSTLQLTLRWPMPSTESKAGDPGPVSLTECPSCGHMHQGAASLCPSCIFDQYGDSDTAPSLSKESGERL